MCGISGLVNCGDGETLARMTNVQTHRGPDDSGLWEQRFPDGSYVGLGSRRLAILDLSSNGQMPMCNEDRTVWITYNGEIYNFADVARRTREQGPPAFIQIPTPKLFSRYTNRTARTASNGSMAFSHLQFVICDPRSRQLFSGPRSLRREAVLLLAARIGTRVCIGDQGAVTSAGNRCGARPAIASSIFDVSLGARSQDDVPKISSSYRRDTALYSGNGELKISTILGSDIS